MMRFFQNLAFVFSIFFLPIAASAETLRIGDLTVTSVWGRASIEVSRPTAVYLTIRNEGRRPEALIGIVTPVAERAVTHRIVVKNEIAHMKPTGSLALPSGSVVKLAPGGAHIMLMNLRRPLKEGGRFSMTLIFKTAGHLTLDVPIRGVAQAAPK